VDHIVPLSRYPQFANELANLQLMPAMQNREKGDRMGRVEQEKLAELQQLLPTGISAAGRSDVETVRL
jgi:CRISPR/Cas system Type II protein with McrA/HNH and RuvC-like nuclease domain